MADEIGALRVNLQANIAEFVSNMKKARNTVQTQTNGMSKAMDKTRSSFSAAGLAFKKVAGVLGGLYLAKQIISLADSYTLLDNKLKLVTSSTEEFKAAQEGLYQQSLRSYSSYESSVDLFTRFARATQSLGTNQKELLRITETINKAFIISGATQQESYNATIQLSQGMAAGALRGEEFNSIMEQGARISQMLAEYLKTDVGGLRAMAKEGKITSEIMVNAFAASAGKIDEEFSKMQPTISQAMTNLKTVFGRLISDSNKSAGGTKLVADEIQKFAETIDQSKPGIIELFTAIIRLAGVTAKAIADISMEAKSMGEGLAAAIHGPAIGDTVRIQKEIDDITKHIARLKKSNDSWMTGLWTEARNNEKITRLQKRLEELNNMQKMSFGGTPTKEEEGGKPKPRTRPTKPAPAPVDKKAISDAEKRYQQGQDLIRNLEREKALIGEVSREEAMRWDTTQGQYKDFTQGQKEALVGLSAEIDAIDKLEEAKKRSAEIDEQATEKRDAILKEIEAIEQQAFAVNMSARELTLQQLVAQGASESQIEFADAMLKTVENAEELKQVLEEIQTPQDEFNAKIEKLDAMLAKGILTWDQYNAAVDRAKEKLKEATEEGKDKFEELKQVIEGWGKQSADAIVDFCMTGKTSFSDMINSMISDLLKMMVYQNITGPLSKGLSSWMGGGSFLTGLLSAATAGKASGGPVSAGRMYEVNERGIPELLSIGNRQFLMMSNQGGMVNNLGESGSSAPGGGDNGNVTIINNNITAMDARSMQEVFRRNSAEITSVINDSLKSNSGLRSTIKRTR